MKGREERALAREDYSGNPSDRRQSIVLSIWGFAVMVESERKTDPACECKSGVTT